MSKSSHKKLPVDGKLDEALFGVHRVPEGGSEITERSPTSLSPEQLALLSQEQTSGLDGTESGTASSPSIKAAAKLRASRSSTDDQ
jgi:hypothetical protein